MRRRAFTACWETKHTPAATPADETHTSKLNVHRTISLVNAWSQSTSRNREPIPVTYVQARHAYSRTANTADLSTIFSCACSAKRILVRPIPLIHLTVVQLGAY